MQPGRCEKQRSGCLVYETAAPIRGLVPFANQIIEALTANLLEWDAL